MFFEFSNLNSKNFRTLTENGQRYLNNDAYFRLPEVINLEAAIEVCKDAARSRKKWKVLRVREGEYPHRHILKKIFPGDSRIHTHFSGQKSVFRARES